MSWGIKEDYYSGQGVVLVGVRGADGKPQGLRPVGNVPDLKIAIETSTLEHKESTTGARGTDLRLTTELKCNLSFTLENFSTKNLADALRGAAKTVVGDTVVDKPLKAYPGTVTALGHIAVSAVSAKIGATALVAYTNDSTPWDYIVNLDAGSVKWNDGELLPVSKLGTAITGVAVGATTSLTVANSGLKVGERTRAFGLTGADAANINGIEAEVLSVNATTVVLDINTAGDTITTAAGSILVDNNISVLLSYTHAKQFQVDALSEGAQELYMRFEGMNTVQGNSPVVVEVFRFLTDPLKELALISDGIQQFVLEGSALADTARLEGSKYFSVQKLS